MLTTKWKKARFHQERSQISVTDASGFYGSEVDTPAADSVDRNESTKLLALDETHLNRWPTIETVSIIPDVLALKRQGTALKSSPSYCAYFPRYSVHRSFQTVLIMASVQLYVSTCSTISWRSADPYLKEKILDQSRAASHWSSIGWGWPHTDVEHHDIF